MSNNNFDSVETALRQLKDIVEQNHSDGMETTLIVQQMERLVVEMKTKVQHSNSSTYAETTPFSIVSASHGVIA